MILEYRKGYIRWNMIFLPRKNVCIKWQRYWEYILYDLKNSVIISLYWVKARIIIIQYDAYIEIYQGIMKCINDPTFMQPMHFPINTLYILWIISWLWIRAVFNVHFWKDAFLHIFCLLAKRYIKIFHMPSYINIISVRIYICWWKSKHVILANIVNLHWMGV